MQSQPDIGYGQPGEALTYRETSLQERARVPRFLTD